MIVYVFWKSLLMKSHEIVLNIHTVSQQYNHLFRSLSNFYPDIHCFIYTKFEFIEIFFRWLFQIITLLLNEISA